MDAICVDLGRGVASVAGIDVAVAAGPDGSLSLGGATIRPLSYGERSTAVGWSLTCADPRTAVVSAIRSAATGGSEVDGVRPEVVDVLALTLAGAGTRAGTGASSGSGAGAGTGAGSGADLPGFAEAALLVARATGWSADQIEATRASQVDSLARWVRGTPPDDGWTRLSFQPGDPMMELAVLRGALADDLITRARTRPAGTPGQEWPPPQPPLAPLLEPAPDRDGARPPGGRAPAWNGDSIGDGRPPEPAYPGLGPSATTEPAADVGPGDAPATTLERAGRWDGAVAGWADGAGAGAVTRAGGEPIAPERPSLPSAATGPPAPAVLPGPDRPADCGPRSGADAHSGGSADPTWSERPALPTATGWAVWQAATRAGAAATVPSLVPATAPATGPAGMVATPPAIMPAAGPAAGQAMAPGGGARPAWPPSPPEWAPGQAPEQAMGQAQAQATADQATADEELAARLARLLHDEADLRGLAP